MNPGNPGGRLFTPDFLTELFRNPLDPGYADAAQRRARSGPPSVGRARQLRALLLLVLSAVGFLLVVAYQQTIAEKPARVQARAGLVQQVKRRQEQTDVLQAQAEQLRRDVAGLRDAALTGTAAARLRDLEAGTGLARVRGPGVVIRLADAPAAADAVTGNKRDPGLILDRDLQLVTNALWSVGAEAISINGQRLTATSTIRAAGEAIMVDLRPVLGPYEVSAIGPEELEERFGETSVARVLRGLVGGLGISFEIRGVDEVTLPAAAEPQLRHARPSPTADPAGAGQPPGRPAGPTLTPGPATPRPAGSPTGIHDRTSTPVEGGR